MASAPEGVTPHRYRARAKYRDVDNKLRDVECYAKTKKRAEADLERALKDHQAAGREDGADGALIHPW